MKIDKNMLDRLAAMDDATLSASIRMIAASTGIDLGGIAFDKTQLDSLRAAMRSATDADIARAGEIIEGYRKE